MSEKRNINLTIADIPLNLNISAADEEIIRKAAKEINERVLKYKTGNTEPEPFYFLAYNSPSYLFIYIYGNRLINLFIKHIQ